MNNLPLEQAKLETVFKAISEILISFEIEVTQKSISKLHSFGEFVDLVQKKNTYPSSNALTKNHLASVLESTFTFFKLDNASGDSKLSEVFPIGKRVDMLKDLEDKLDMKFRKEVLKMSSLLIVINSLGLITIITSMFLSWSVTGVLGAILFLINYFTPKQFVFDTSDDLLNYLANFKNHASRQRKGINPSEIKTVCEYIFQSNNILLPQQEQTKFNWEEA